MRRVDYVYFIKPLLRSCGLALLLIFLITSLFSAYPFQFYRFPAEALQKLTEFLERSNLLAVALLLIVLSLADHARPPSDPLRRQPSGLRDRMLLRARPLVGLAALFYLLIIPFTLVQAQLLNNMGGRMLGRQAESVNQQLNAVKQEIESKRLTSASLPALKKKYPWVNSPQITSIPDLKTRVEAGLKKAGSIYIEQRSSGSKQVYGFTTRICLLAGIQSLLIGYMWFYWPRRVPRQLKLDGKELAGVGAEAADLPEDLMTR